MCVYNVTCVCVRIRSVYPCLYDVQSDYLTCFSSPSPAFFCISLVIILTFTILFLSFYILHEKLSQGRSFTEWRGTAAEPRVVLFKVTEPQRCQHAVPACFIGTAQLPVADGTDDGNVIFLIMGKPRQAEAYCWLCVLELNLEQRWQLKLTAVLRVWKWNWSWKLYQFPNYWTVVTCSSVGSVLPWLWENAVREYDTVVAECDGTCWKCH